MSTTTTSPVPAIPEQDTGPTKLIKTNLDTMDDGTKREKKEEKKEKKKKVVRVTKTVRRVANGAIENINPREKDNFRFNEKNLQPHEVDFIIYHCPCPDGFTSALCCYYYRSQNKMSLEESDITFVPAQHNNSHRIPEGIEGKNVLICDFSYKKELIDEMLTKVNKLLILDHHKSARGFLEDVPDKHKVFAMNHSGAYITWRYFFGYSEPVPKMITYIEDHDIWLKAQPKTDEFSAYVSTLPFEFSEYGKLLNDKYVDDVVLPLGTGMVLQNHEYIKRCVSKTIPRFVQIRDKYYFVGFCEQSILRSEIGNKAFDELEYLNFSAIFSHDLWSGRTSYSLRSKADRTDVSEIAGMFGGGGHRNAAGCGTSVETNSLPCKMIDNYDLYYTLENIYCIEREGLRIVAFNNASHAKRMACYLMQERTPGVQEGSYILMKNTENDISENVTYDCSVVFSRTGKRIKGYVKMRDDAGAEVQEAMTKLFGAELELSENGFGSIDMLVAPF